MLYEDREVNLEAGMVIKNYKEMCKIMGENVTDGNSKKAQITNWSRYFDFVKNGQKFIIVEIYDEPFPTAEIHRRREGLYVQYIECLLMDIIANNSKDKEFTISKKELYYLLGMVNDKYAQYYNDKNALVDLINKIANADMSDNASVAPVTLFDVKEFYMYTNFRLNNILTSALKSMSGRNLIAWFPAHKIVLNKGSKIFPCEEDYFGISEDEIEFMKKLNATQRLATFEEEKIILGIKREALLKVNCYNLEEVIRRDKLKDYYVAIDDITHMCYPEWEYFYSVLRLVHSDDLKAQVPLQAEAVRKLTTEQQKLELNSRICNTINSDSGKRYCKNQEKVKEQEEEQRKAKELEDDGWGTPNPMRNTFKKKVFTYNDNYVNNQNRLVDYAISLKSNKNTTNA